MTKMDPKKSDLKRRLVPMIFLVAAALFLVLSILQPDPPTVQPSRGVPHGGKPPSTSKVDVHSAEYSQRVNAHLKMTEQKMLIQQQAMAIENHKARLRNLQNPENPSTVTEPTDPPSGFDTFYAQEEQGSDLTEKIRGRQHTQDISQDPAEAIQLELFQAQIARDYSAEYKRIYAEEFVKNARKQGVEIMLSPAPEYRILSVRRFNIKKAPSLFEE
jgi:hypothetical protein